jgi:DNA repair protein RecO (recombination protein O)
LSRTYRVTGINLKAAPFGERDRLLTILTREQGLLRAVAGGARQHQSRMAGRSTLFVVNDLHIVRGRSLDRITQVETITTLGKLSQNLARLTAAQYLAELTLFQAIAAQPQEELFVLLLEHLQRLESCALPQVLPSLVQGAYHLLAIAGVAPQVFSCCVRRVVIAPDALRVGFSAAHGGMILDVPTLPPSPLLTAEDIAALQELPQSDPPQLGRSPRCWLRIEKLLRTYAEYHLDKSLYSATLIDSCFHV